MQELESRLANAREETLQRRAEVLEGHGQVSRLQAEAEYLNEQLENVRRERSDLEFTVADLRTQPN